MITRILMDKVYDDQKILIIVPSISLVTQLFGDFVDYSKVNEWDTDHHVHSIMGGIKKDADKKIYISTWQSLQHIKDKEYFEKFGAVIVDECHGASLLSFLLLWKMY
jgi:superfamily II DNA or RNA helicase